jgi:hypothetical protein
MILQETGSVCSELLYGSFHLFNHLSAFEDL